MEFSRNFSSLNRYIRTLYVLTQNRTRRTFFFPQERSISNSFSKFVILSRKQRDRFHWPTRRRFNDKTRKGAIRTKKIESRDDARCLSIEASTDTEAVNGADVKS